ncbi:hypothetical protein ACLI4Z_17230 [Natrialbaceae archaeon A-arb3/5]
MSGDQQDPVPASSLRPETETRREESAEPTGGPTLEPTDGRRSRANRSERWTVGWRSALESPLLGQDARLSALAIGTMLSFAALAILAVALDGVVPATEIAVTGYDRLRATTIQLAMVLILVAPVAYGLRNGGPVLSYALALCPLGIAFLASGQLALTTDFVVVLLMGATGASLATVVPAVRRSSTRLPAWSIGFENGLLISTATTVLALVGTTRLATTGVHPFGAHAGVLVALVGLPLSIVVFGWVGWYHADRHGEEQNQTSRTQRSSVSGRSD